MKNSLAKYFARWIALAITLTLLPAFATAQVQDVTPPNLVAVSFTPSNIDTSAGSQSVALTIAVTDDLSGYQRAFFQLESPSGAQSIFGAITQLVSGDAYSGTYQTLVNFPQFSEAGNWHFVYLRLDDQANNIATLFAPQLAALGISAQVTVLGQQDTSAPTLTQINLSPGTIDTSTGPQTVTLTIQVTDDVSGFQRAFFSLESPSGAQSLFGLVDQIVSGTRNSGTFQSQVVFPQYSEVGAWRVGYFRLDDLANNSVTLFNSQLVGLGLSPTVTVTGVAPDTAPPNLVTIVLNPANIDVSQSAKVVTITAQIADSLSGFQRGLFELTSPSGTQSLFGSLALISGDVHIGTYQAEVVVPKFSETGYWRFGYLRLDDMANNTIVLTDAQLIAMGFTPRVLVSVDSSRPVISGMPVCNDKTLWPANGRLVDVATISAVGGLSGLAFFDVSATSNELLNPDPDVVISGDGLQPRNVQLRAKRGSNGSERTYTITATAVSGAGVTNTLVARCTVPRGQGNGK